MLGVINDILDFSKVESNRLELERIPVSLTDLVRDVQSLFLHLAQERHLELIFAQDAAVSTHILGDPTRLRQVLVNLINNGLKFTRQGQVTVSLRVEADEHNSQMLDFSIRNTGIGIAPQQLRYLFEPFTQCDASSTRHYGGTGLGWPFASGWSN